MLLPPVSYTPTAQTLPPTAATPPRMLLPEPGLGALTTCHPPSPPRSTRVSLLPLAGSTKVPTAQTASSWAVTPHSEVQFDPARGRLTVFQVPSWYSSTRGRPPLTGSSSSPTAQTVPSDAATPCRNADPSATTGDATTDQAVPSQCSISGVSGPEAPS